MRKLKFYYVRLTADAEFIVPASSRELARLKAYRVTDDQPIFPGWKVRRCVVRSDKRREPTVDWLTPKQPE